MTENKGSLLPAIVGGIIGSAITAGGLLLAAPQLISGKVVRQAMLDDPQILVDAADVLRDAVAPLKMVGPANGKQGTKVTFLPSGETFKVTMPIFVDSSSHSVSSASLITAF